MENYRNYRNYIQLKSEKNPQETLIPQPENSTEIFKTTTKKIPRAHTHTHTHTHTHIYIYIYIYPQSDMDEEIGTRISDTPTIHRLKKSDLH